MPDLKLSEPPGAPGRSDARHRQRWLPQALGWDGDAAGRTLRRVAATLAPRALWRDHRLLVILVALSLIPRVFAALAFRPALLTSDSFLYMQEAAKGTLGKIRPSGYSLMLDVLRPLPHALLAITTVQHLMGIGIAVIIYAVLRYWSLPAWGACLAALPTLFDPRQIALESYILPDTLYNLMLVAAAALLLTRRTPRLWQCGLAGLLVAYVSVLRGNGLPLAVIFAVFILIRRAGWRASPRRPSRSWCRSAATCSRSTCSTGTSTSPRAKASSCGHARRASQIARSSSRRRIWRRCAQTGRRRSPRPVPRPPGR